MRHLVIFTIALALAAFASRNSDDAYWGRVATAYKDIEHGR